MRRITEEASHYDDLEQKPVAELLCDINREDHYVADAVEQALPQITRLTETIVERMRRGGRLFYIGAGTSGRLGVLDASELPPTYGTDPRLVVGLIAGGDTALCQAVEHAEDDGQQGWKDLVEQGLSSDDTVVGIAASGTTPYVVGALREARRHGVVTGCITSNPDTPLETESDYPVVTIVGPEFVTGSSRMKSGTAQKMVLNMISTTVMIRLGRVKGNKMVDMELTNDKLIDRAVRMVMGHDHLSYDAAKKKLMQNSLDEIMRGPDAIE